MNAFDWKVAEIHNLCVFTTIYTCYLDGLRMYLPVAVTTVPWPHR